MFARVSYHVNLTAAAAAARRIHVSFYDASGELLASGYGQRRIAPILIITNEISCLLNEMNCSGEFDVTI